MRNRTGSSTPSRAAVLVSFVVAAVLGVACDSESSCPEPSSRVVNGCPTYLCALTSRGGDTQGDDYASYAEPLFGTYCVRCHSVTRTTASTACADTDPLCRHGAPVGFNWDDPASIRVHLADIRYAIGEENFMPPSGLQPTCDERMRLVRWIDAGAPGLP